MKCCNILLLNKLYPVINIIMLNVQILPHKNKTFIYFTELSFDIIKEFLNKINCF